MSINSDVPATYRLTSGDPARRFTDYFPAWADHLADDATLEGSMLDGAVQGREAVRNIVVTIRSLYERQEFNFAGPYGDDNGWLEDYLAEFHGGVPIACTVLVTRTAEGQTTHIAATYRPRSSLMLLSRLLREKFAGAPYGDQFARASSDADLPDATSTRQSSDAPHEDTAVAHR